MFKEDTIRSIMFNLLLSRITQKSKITLTMNHKRITYKTKLLNITNRIITMISQLKTFLKMITILTCNRIINTPTTLSLINLKRTILRVTTNHLKSIITRPFKKRVTLTSNNLLRITFNPNKQLKTMEIYLILFLTKPMSKEEKSKLEDTNQEDTQMTTTVSEVPTDMNR